jgi:hypothetical protein
LCGNPLAQDNAIVILAFGVQSLIASINTEKENSKVYDFEKDNDQDSALIEFWFAARDKRQMLSNTMRGKREKVLRGEYMGGGHRIGYDVVPTEKINAKGIPMKTMAVNPEEAQLVRKIFSMYVEHSATRVTAILNEKGIPKPVKHPWNLKKSKGKFRLWEANGIIRIISNPIYAGWKHWSPRPNRNGEVNRFLRDMEPQMHFDPSLQIVSQQMFDRVQRIRKERSREGGKSANSQMPFSSILKCPHCGGAMGGNIRWRGKDNKKYLQHSYRCLNHYDNPHLCPNGFQTVFVSVASAVIPFVVSGVKDKSHLVDLLNKAAIELSSSSTAAMRRARYVSIV